MTDSPDAIPDFDLDEVHIRAAGPADHPTALELFQESVLERQLRDGDTGADIDHLVEGYLSDDGSRLWVAEYAGAPVGMVGVQRTKADTAEIRRLRVRTEFRRRGIGSKLLGHAIGFCRETGYLKVVLDVRIERSPAIAMFDKLGFTLARTREIEDHKLHVFYLDLYRGTS